MNRPRQAFGTIVLLLIALVLTSQIPGASAQQGMAPAVELLNVNAAGPCSPACGGFVYFQQAENATLTEPMTAVYDGAACDQVYIHTPQRTEAAEAVFTFYIQTAGSYNIWVRAMGLDLLHNSFWVSLDDEPADPGYHYEIPTFGGAFTWGWDALRPAQTDPAPVQLAAGWHNLRFRGREENARLDAIFITSDVTCDLAQYNATPTPTPTLTATQNATQTPTHTPTRTVTPTRMPTPPGGIYPSVLREDVEGAWPGAGWELVDQSARDGGEYLFGQRSCYPRNGSYAAWAMGGGAQGGALECSSPYPANADTWAVYGPFSLVGATQAELTFYLYGNTQESANCSNDYLFVGAATDGKNFSGGRLCGPYQAGPDGRGFTGFRLNLADWLGQPRVWVAMAFESDGSVTEFGYMIDDIALSATFGADSRMVRLPILLQGVQHSQPTLTPTRTQTQPAATATPTASPTPSPRPTRILRYDEENAEIRRAPFPVVSPARVSIQALRFDEPVARELVAVQFVVLTEDGTAVDETVGIEVWQADSSGKAATRVHQQQETIRLAAGERAELTYSLTSGPKTVGPVFYVGMRTLSTNRPKPVMPGGIYKDSEVTPADFYRSYGRLGSNDPPTEKIPWGNLVIRAVVLE